LLVTGQKKHEYRGENKLIFYTLITLTSSITGERRHYIHKKNIRGHQEEAHANYPDASDPTGNFSGDRIHVLGSAETIKMS
jgi:hypothetical protein